ncbi:hypothetical protein R1sor_009941 [Riccia sorocarpa]|uniref:Dehydroascorbate reductase n=1 Tax=Riccia sorocarpa TaxID=122646 RepID=A0ABD3HWI7_9MARC
MRAVAAISSSVPLTCLCSSRVVLSPSSTPIISRCNRPVALFRSFPSSSWAGKRRTRESRCEFVQLDHSTEKRLSLVVVRGSASPAVEAPVRTTLESMEVLVKAATGHPDKLGDCPFSQRVLLTLEEKHIPYSAKYVDMSNKPQWFLEANPGGKVPVIKHEEKWIADSDVITVLLEELHPEPSLVSPEETKSVGSNIFGAFIKFLTSKDPADGTEKALLDELTAIDEQLKKSGKYINGEKVTSVDLALAPKLYHLKTALGHYKKWAVPDSLPNVKRYMEDLFSRESFQKTKAVEEYVVKGWEAKVNAA